jgi:hypothetical protein
LGYVDSVIPSFFILALPLIYIAREDLLSNTSILCRYTEHTPVDMEEAEQKNIHFSFEPETVFFSKTLRLI